MQALQSPENIKDDSSVSAIVECIRPAVQPLLPLLEEDTAQLSASLLERGVRANIAQSVRQLREDSAVLSRLARECGLQIVGAEYDLQSGVVEFDSIST